MANKLADGIEETIYVRHHILLMRYHVPEQRKITGLQHAGEPDDVQHGIVVHLGWQKQTLAQREISVRQIGQRLEQNGVRNIHIQAARIELIQLQNGQVSFQIIGVVAGLLFHILLDDI